MYVLFPPSQFFPTPNIFTRVTLRLVLKAVSLFGQDVEMSINRGMDKDNAVHTCDGILLSHEKEGNNAVGSNMDGLRDDQFSNLILLSLSADLSPEQAAGTSHLLVDSSLSPLSSLFRVTWGTFLPVRRPRPHYTPIDSECVKLFI